MQRSARPALDRPYELANGALWTTLRPFVLRRLSREIARPRSPEDWIRFVSTFQMRLGIRRYTLRLSFRSVQIPSEITRLVELVAAEKPRRVLEIGSQGGGTLFLFARVAAPDALLVGTDLPPDGYGGGLSDWRATLFERGFAGPQQRVRTVRGDSHAEATKARILEALDGGPVDFLFIDADHTYDGVKRDFELYAPLVRPGGLIAMHDIVRDGFHRTGVRTDSDSGEVFRFWEEVKATHPNRATCREFVEDPGQDGFGIGLLRA